MLWCLVINMECVYLSKELLTFNLLYVGKYQGVSNAVKWTKPNAIYVELLGWREMGLPLAHPWLITPDICVVPLTNNWFSEQPVSLGAASVCALLLTYSCYLSQALPGGK